MSATPSPPHHSLNGGIRIKREEGSRPRSYSPVAGRSRRSRSGESDSRRSRSRSPVRKGGSPYNRRSRSRDPSLSRSRSRSPIRGPRRSRYSNSPSRDRRRRYSKSPSYDRSRRNRGGGGGGRYYEERRDNPRPNRCLGIFGLSLYTTERQITRIFEKFGQIDKVQVVLDSKTGRSRGFAFVYYDQVDEAADAKDACSGMEIDGRVIRVDFSITERPHTPTPGIYMGKPTILDRRDRGYGGSYNRNYGGGGGGGGGGYNNYNRRRSPSPYKKRFRSRSRSYSPRRSNRY